MIAAGLSWVSLCTDACHGRNIVHDGRVSVSGSNGSQMVDSPGSATGTPRGPRLADTCPCPPRRRGLGDTDDRGRRAHTAVWRSRVDRKIGSPVLAICGSYCSPVETDVVYWLVAERGAVVNPGRSSRSMTAVCFDGFWDMVRPYAAVWTPPKYAPRAGL